jgi:hypothetical protein
MKKSDQFEQLVESAVTKRLAGIDKLIDERVARALSQRLFKPRLSAMNRDGASPFMQYSNCSAADMLHPRYGELCSFLQRSGIASKNVGVDLRDASPL